MNKLSELINSLSAREKRQFSEFLHSSVTRTASPMIKAFKAAVEVLENSAEIDKKAIYKKAKSVNRYDDKEYRYLQSELCRHLEYFLVEKHLESNKMQFNSLLLQSLTERNCIKSAKYILGIIRSEEIKSLEYFRIISNSEENVMSLLSRHRRHLPENYNTVSEHIDAFYILKKLKMFCELINRQNILGNKTEINFYNEINTISSHNQFRNIPLIAIYREILITLTETNNEASFDLLQKLVSRHKDIIEVSELKEIYQYIKNFCIRKINEGRTDYTEKLYKIYKDILSNEKLMRSEYLSQFEFKNIVSIGIRLKENKWSRWFIDKYINYTRPEERSNVFKYNMAFWYFHSGEFKRAIKSVRDVEFTDVVYQLDSRVILLKSYYELDEQESFFYHASAFRLFILRNRHISDYQKKINRNLIRFLSAIVRAGTSKTKLDRLKMEIQKEKNVADINWLIEKIDALH